jgi:hypothetical protein
MGSISILFSHLRLHHSRDVLPSGISTKTCTHTSCFQCVLHVLPILFSFIILIISDEVYKLRRSQLHSSLQILLGIKRVVGSKSGGDKTEIDVMTAIDVTTNIPLQMEILSDRETSYRLSGH